MKNSINYCVIQWPVQSVCLDLRWTGFGHEYLWYRQLRSFVTVTRLKGYCRSLQKCVYSPDIICAITVCVFERECEMQCLFQYKVMIAKTNVSWSYTCGVSNEWTFQNMHDCTAEGWSKETSWDYRLHQVVK